MTQNDWSKTKMVTFGVTMAAWVLSHAAIVADFLACKLSSFTDWEKIHLS